MRRMSRHGRGDRGAVAIIVAMLFGFGVMIGAAALTIDVGRINLDRRQLQNGADAAAVSAARDCAVGNCPNATAAAGSAALAAYTRLGTLANGNAADGATKVARVDGGLAVCGTAPGLTSCPAPTAGTTPGIQECPSTPLSAKYVRVYTETQDAAGNTILPYTFGAAITGAGTGANQQTCATVGYGNGKATGPVLPIAMSYCEWKTGVGYNPSADPTGTYVSPPNYDYGVTYGYVADTSSLTTPPWPTATEKEIYTAKSKASPGCTTWNGHVTPGNFSALTQTPAGSCTVFASDFMVGDTGNDSPCTDAQLAKYLGKIVLVPLFDCVASSPTLPSNLLTGCQAGGNNAFYSITGYASFYLTGWQFSGTKSPYDTSIHGGHKVCQGATGDSGRCLSGWFTHTVISAGEIDQSGPPDFGSVFTQILQ